jgi:hypothetical protein
MINRYSKFIPLIALCITSNTSPLNLPKLTSEQRAGITIAGALTTFAAGAWYGNYASHATLAAKKLELQQKEAHAELLKKEAAANALRAQETAYKQLTTIAKAYKQECALLDETQQATLHKKLEQTIAKKCYSEQFPALTYYKRLQEDLQALKQLESVVPETAKKEHQALLEKMEKIQEESNILCGETIRIERATVQKLAQAEEQQKIKLAKDKLEVEQLRYEASHQKQRDALLQNLKQRIDQFQDHQASSAQAVNDLQALSSKLATQLQTNSLAIEHIKQKQEHLQEEVKLQSNKIMVFVEKALNKISQLLKQPEPTAQAVSAQTYYVPTAQPAYNPYAYQTAGVAPVPSAPPL